MTLFLKEGWIAVTDSITNIIWHTLVNIREKKERKALMHLIIDRLKSAFYNKVGFYKSLSGSKSEGIFGNESVIQSVATLHVELSGYREIQIKH